MTQVETLDGVKWRVSIIGAVVAFIIIIKQMIDKCTFKDSLAGHLDELPSRSVSRRSRFLFWRSIHGIRKSACKPRYFENQKPQDRALNWKFSYHFQLACNSIAYQQSHLLKFQFLQICSTQSLIHMASSSDITALKASSNRPIGLHGGTNSAPLQRILIFIHLCDNMICWMSWEWVLLPTLCKLSISMNCCSLSLPY